MAGGVGLSIILGLVFTPVTYRLLAPSVGSHPPPASDTAPSSIPAPAPVP